MQTRQLRQARFGEKNRVFLFDATSLKMIHFKYNFIQLYLGVFSFMFFVGIFGINEKEKPVTTYNNIVCPSCQALTHLDIFKAYSYFHFLYPHLSVESTYYGIRLLLQCF